MRLLWSLCEISARGNANSNLHVWIKMLVLPMLRLNLRHIFLFPFSVLLCTSVNAGETTEFDNTLPLAKDLDVIAFVGEKISFEEKRLLETISITKADGTIVERTLPQFDTRYEAKYKVLAWVSEEMTNEVIDFEVYDHYGRPQLPTISKPLVFLVNYKGRWVQSKYNNYRLSRTTDGDWGICGKPARYETNKDQGERYVQPLSFIKPIKNHQGEICKLGTRVTDILKYQNETRFLPTKWKITCNLELGLQRNVVAGTGPAPDAEQIGLTHAACVERLKFENGVFQD